MSLPKCTSWLGHRFAARYSTAAVKFKSDELNALALVNRNEEKTYERDICVRCGVTVEKNTTPNPVNSQANKPT